MWAAGGIILQTHTFISPQVFFSRIQAHSVILYRRIIPNTALEKKNSLDPKERHPSPQGPGIPYMQISVPDERQLLLTHLSLAQDCGRA